MTNKNRGGINLAHFRINNSLYYLPLEQLLINLDFYDRKDDIDIDILLNQFTQKKEINIIRNYYKLDEILPSNIGLLLTNRCQMNCSYCYNESGSGDNTTLNREQIEVIIQ